MLDALEARAFEERGRDRASVSGRADDGERLAAVLQFGGDAVAELVERNVDRARHVALLPLVLVAHVQDAHLAAADLLRETRHVDGDRGARLEAGFAPRSRPAGEK